MNASAYNTVRNELLRDNGRLIEIERAVSVALLKGLHRYAPAIKADFDTAVDLRMFWEEYAPLQRGHKPRDSAIPWGEVGEKVVEAHLYSMLDQIFPPESLRFPGIPYGHDVRFLTDKAFVQIDVKSTGPTDNVNEVVASPNQVTGEGVLVKGLVTNVTRQVRGKRRTIDFRPELSPFVVIRGKVYPVVTLYIKVVYSAPTRGNQPLDSMELASVPNGLLMFTGLNYHEAHPGLLIPGKDEVGVTRKRTRIRLDPLAAIAD